MVWQPWFQVMAGLGGVLFVLLSDQRRRARGSGLTAAVRADAAFLFASLLLVGMGVMRWAVGAATAA